MTYSSVYYHSHRGAYQMAQKKWRDGVRKEMLEKGLIKPKKSKEEQRIENLKNANTLYKNNTDGYADRAKTRYMDKYNSDPEFRLAAKIRLKEWRENKKKNTEDVV